MPITRRKFLKHLAFFVPAVAIAPAAVAKLAVDIAKKPLYQAIPKYGPWTEWLTIDEFRARYVTRLDKNPLFSGQLGIYEGVTLHRHK